MIYSQAYDTRVCHNIGHIPQSSWGPFLVFRINKSTLEVPSLQTNPLISATGNEVGHTQSPSSVRWFINHAYYSSIAHKP